MAKVPNLIRNTPFLLHYLSPTIAAPNQLLLRLKQITGDASRPDHIDNHIHSSDSEAIFVKKCGLDICYGTDENSNYAYQTYTVDTIILKTNL